MRIKKNNTQKESTLNAKFNPAKVLDIQIDVDNYRQYNSTMIEDVNPKDVQAIRSIYNEYEKRMEEVVASRIADMVPTAIIECIEELKRLEHEIVDTKNLLGRKQAEKHQVRDTYKEHIVEAEVMIIKDKLENKKLDLSKFIAQNKDIKLSSDLEMLDYELNENLNNIISEIDDITLALSAQINFLKALRGFVYDSKKIVRQQLSKRLGHHIDLRFKQLINEETPLLMIVNNKKVLE